MQKMGKSEPLRKYVRETANKNKQTRRKHRKKTEKEEESRNNLESSITYATPITALQTTVA